jgi:hypothetical protein
MNFYDFVPAPVRAGAILLFVPKISNPTPLKKELVSTALAVAGYFLANRYAKCVDLELWQVAALTALVLPNVARLGIGGYAVAIGVSRAFAVGMSNKTALATSLALAALGYFSNTVFGREWIELVVYDTAIDTTTKGWKYLSKLIPSIGE